MALTPKHRESEKPVEAAVGGVCAHPLSGEDVTATECSRNVLSNPIIEISCADGAAVPASEMCAGVELNPVIEVAGADGESVLREHSGQTHRRLAAV